MIKKAKAIERQINGINIYQQKFDGYLNVTQLCKVHHKTTGDLRDPNEILKTKTMELAIVKLSSDTNISVADLVYTKTGGKYQGTWIHPRLAVRFTMLLNEDFSLQVEDWVHQWFKSGNNPIKLETDIDRVSIRDELKDNRRLALTEQIKFFLQAVGTYNPKSKETRIFFGKVHNEINVLLTTEKALEMRERLEKYLEKKVSEQELLRDYYPIVDLANFAAVCQAAANNMENGMHPINAVRLAVKQVLPNDYKAKPINFTERIALVRQRISDNKNKNLLK